MSRSNQVIGSAICCMLPAVAIVFLYFLKVRILKKRPSSLMIIKKPLIGPVGLKLRASPLHTGWVVLLSLLIRRHVFFWSLSRWSVFPLNQPFGMGISLKALRDWSLESIKARSDTTLSWLKVFSYIVRTQMMGISFHSQSLHSVHSVCCREWNGASWPWKVGI